jgi:hypothetical protein
MLKMEFVPVNGKRRVVPIVIVVASFLVGWAIMVLIAVFEDEMKFDFSETC